MLATMTDSRTVIPERSTPKSSISRIVLGDPRGRVRDFGWHPWPYYLNLAYLRVDSLEGFCLCM
jgi:hypothetical protein